VLSLSPMNYVGVRTPKCRWGHATFLCPGTQRTKEDTGANRQHFYTLRQLNLAWRWKLGTWSV